MEDSQQTGISSQVIDQIGIATIDKPPVNSLGKDLCEALLAAFDEFDQEEARVIILRANPTSKIWSAGHDIREGSQAFVTKRKPEFKQDD